MDNGGMGRLEPERYHYNLPGYVHREGAELDNADRWVLGPYLYRLCL